MGSVTKVFDTCSVTPQKYNHQTSYKLEFRAVVFIYFYSWKIIVALHIFNLTFKNVYNILT